MRKVLKIWILSLLTPFLIGTLIYVIVPLQFIITSNLKLQNTFNGYKIQSQLNTVRTISYLNAKVINTRLQTYINILSTFMELFDRNDMNNTFSFANIQLNSAYQLANHKKNFSQINYNLSMWYSPNVSNVTAMNANQKLLFNKYLQVQTYLQTIFNNKMDLFSAIEKVYLYSNYNESQILFNYPSQINQRYQLEGASIMDEFYNMTIQNYQYKNSSMIMFDIGQWQKFCAISTQLVKYVICIDVLVKSIIKDLVIVSSIPQFQLSTYEYFVLRSVYEIQQYQHPIIIANFSSENLSNINIPTKNLYENQQLPISWFKNSNYEIKLKRSQKTKTYISLPIKTYDHDIQYQVNMYLMVLNNFAKAELSEQSRASIIAIIMIVPSVVIVFFSVVATFITLRSILKKFQTQLIKVYDYCSLIKREDLQLQISHSNNAIDLCQLFEQIRKLNQLSKYSNYNYFSVPKSQRIVRLLKCIKFFQQLNYDKTNLFENISQCYVFIGDYTNAIKFLKISIDNTIEILYGKQSQIQTIYQAKVNERIKINRSFRKKQKVLNKKILRLCQILYTYCNLNNHSYQKQICSKAQLLRKISYPQILNYEYIACLMFIIGFKIRNREFTDIMDKMQILYELLKGYEEVNQLQSNCQTPPCVMYSYWHSMMGTYYLMNQEFVRSYDHYVESLKGNRFDPNLHIIVHKQIHKLLQLFNIRVNQLSQFKYIEQYNSRTQRQYIFLIDISNPYQSGTEINRWKKQTRDSIQFIFNSCIKNNDRISIIQYCLDIKIICNLVQKQNRQKLLKKQLLRSVTTKTQRAKPHLIASLRKTIQRIKGLKKQKIVLLYSKGKQQINCYQLQEQFKQIENGKLILLLQSLENLKFKTQNIFVFDLEDSENILRLLQQKVIKQADRIQQIF